jgi:hypothetical protein
MYEAYWSKIAGQFSYVLLWQQGYESPIKLQYRPHCLIEQTLKGCHNITFDDGLASFVENACKIIWSRCLFSRQVVNCLLDLSQGSLAKSFQSENYLFIWACPADREEGGSDLIGRMIEQAD